MKVPGLGRSGDVNPIEAYMLLALEIQGITVLLGIADPTSVRQALPAAAIYIWATMLALGGATALTGLFWWGNPFNGVEIRRVGLVACAAACLVYAVAAIILGAPGVAVAVYNALFSTACIVLVNQISHRLRLARDHLSEVRTESAAVRRGAT